MQHGRRDGESTKNEADSTKPVRVMREALVRYLKSDVWFAGKMFSDKQFQDNGHDVSIQLCLTSSS